MTATATPARSTGLVPSGTATAFARHRTPLLLGAAVVLLLLGSVLVGRGSWPGTSPST